MTFNRWRDDEFVDVAVVGGSAAGLSGALTLARARRRVVAIDAGSPRNRASPHLHGLLGHDGLAPDRLLADGRAEVVAYGGRLVSAVVTGAEQTGGDFRLTLDDGQQVGSRRLLVATGLREELPVLDGLREQWGRGVVNCPYCHGWEVRDGRIGVLATGPASPRQALLLRQWSATVIYLTSGGPEPEEEQRSGLVARGIVLDARPIARVVSDSDGRLAGVAFADGQVRPLDALFLAPPLTANDQLLCALGARREPSPVGGRWVSVDATGLTSVPGLWAAGNVSNPQANLAVAIAAGAWAGAAINADLVEEETRRALAATSG